MFEIKEILFDSQDYEEEKRLRSAVLREPLGLKLTEADTEKDSINLHFGVFNSTGELVACVLFLPLNGANLQLRQMAIHADSQQQGIGRKLLEYAEEQLKRQHYKRIDLDARVTAQSFYASCGYIALGAVFTYMTIPHIKMYKSL